MKKIICYCSGGLGNRLKPIASCWELAHKMNREFVIVWEPTLRCLAPFESIFSNKNISFLPQSELATLIDVKVYCPDGAADYECNLNKFTGLRDLVRRIGSTPFELNTVLNDHTSNIVIFANTFLPGISDIDHKHIIQKVLKVNKDILDKVEEFWRNSGLETSYIGVHARGTDFEDSGINADYYLNRMSVFSNGAFFVCSDSPEYERYIKEKDGRHIVIRSDKKYVSKQNNGAWSNNVYTPTDSVQDSYVDLLLLARTNFRIYHPNSSFAHLANYYKGFIGH